MKLNEVFKTGKIKNLTLKNRLVVSAMSSHLGNPDGTPNEAVIRYHEEKIKGGWGLVFTEDLGVTPDAGCDPVVGSLWNDAQIPAWKELVDRVHALGGKMGTQIYHAGRERTLDVYDSHPIGPSAIKEPTMSYVPREMTIDEIKDMVKAFAKCAERVVKCGFDIVEIHGSHGYLINTFMSGFANKRCDEYGGTLENRMRFPLEVVAAVRAVVGEDYPICFRMNISDYVEGGIELPEAIVMAKMLEEAGVDVLHCSQGTYASKQNTIAPGFIPVMNYSANVAAVKAAVSIPVIAVGRYNDINMAESVLRDGKCDYVAMARASLADPYLPKKAMEGRTDEIIHCIGCCQGCTGEAAVGGMVNCLVNPHTGKEMVYNWSPVKTPKRVLIAGGGVAGMAAAIAAAERGNQVVLYEEAEQLGGQWIAAAMPPGKSEYVSLIIHNKQELKRLGVEVKLATPLTKTSVTESKPDVVILATGGKPMVPPITGINQDNVKTAIDVLRGRTIAGKKAVVLGGGMTGVDTAIFLGVQGCEVALIEMAPEILSGSVSQPRLCMTGLLKNYDIDVHVSTKLTKIEDNTVFAETFGKPVAFEHIDTVVNALGVRSYNPLADELKDCGCKLLVVGDAKKSKNGYKNIREGYDAGNSID